MKSLKFSINHDVFVMFFLMALSVTLHLLIITKLNIVEDESAYLQDAWQISSQVLPFREFGATKGPIYLFVLKAWQMMTTNSVLAGRMFSVFAHVISIPFFYFFVRRLTTTRALALLSAGVWAAVPVAVSLTTNAMHFPLELLLVFIALSLMVQKQPMRIKDSVLVALLYLMALLSRATALAFAPVVLLLAWYQPRRWRTIITIAVAFIVALSAVIAVVYPLYGWPKTAFFFNADATLIAKDQKTVYSRQDQSVLKQAFIGLLPMFYEGMPVIVGAMCLPFFLLMKNRIINLVVASTVIFFSAALAGPVFENLGQFWPGEQYLDQVNSAKLVYYLLFSLAAASIAISSRPRPTLGAAQTKTTLLVIVWLVSFYLFYRNWGRTPTPYYVLEFIPALIIAASLSLYYIRTIIREVSGSLYYTTLAGLGASIIFNSALAYTALPQRQYRGTMTYESVLQITDQIKRLVPPEEAIFTAQPVYAYASGRRLFGYLTHPGWYLAERAGFLPQSIRKIFFPDLQDLAGSIKKEINWIVFDWRTEDVYFNTASSQTEELRNILSSDFRPVVTVENPASRPITLYRRAGASSLNTP